MRLLLFLFYSWRNWSSEKLNDLPEVTQLINNWTRIRIQVWVSQRLALHREIFSSSGTKSCWKMQAAAGELPLSIEMWSLFPGAPCNGERSSQTKGEQRYPCLWELRAIWFRSDGRNREHRCGDQDLGEAYQSSESEIGAAKSKIRQRHHRGLTGRCPEAHDNM